MIEKSTPRCPDCNSLMTQRTNRRTGMDFWGCSTYPECNGTREIDQEEHHDDSDARNDLPSSRMGRNDHRRWRE